MTLKPKTAEFDSERIADLCALVYMDRLPENDVRSLQAKHGHAGAEKIFRDRGKIYEGTVRSTLRALKWTGVDTSAFDTK